MSWPSAFMWHTLKYDTAQFKLDIYTRQISRVTRQLHARCEEICLATRELHASTEQIC